MAPGAPPPALDPRMDRPPSPDDVVWSILVVPRAGSGTLHELHVTRSQLRAVRGLAVGLIAAFTLLIAAVGLLGPQGFGASSLVTENLQLKRDLLALEAKMADVDRVMLRLRVYDAQLRGLTEAHGDHGPEISASAFTNGGLADLGDDRPPRAWTESVGRRADVFLTLADRLEPQLGTLVERLEDTRALAEALPSSWPVDGAITSAFGWRRHPIMRRWKFHSGYDIDGEWGTSIRAPADGVVRSVEWTTGYGLCMVVDHGYGVSTLYGHLWRSRVKAGEKVARGQRIASMGSTGMSTGPHLHYEVRIDDNPVDPADYLVGDRR